jgi:acetolactate decarboxylase
MAASTTRRTLGSILVVAALLLTAACTSDDDGSDDQETESSSPPGPDAVRQVGTITALSGGAYDGSESIEDLARQGTLGLGTYDALDGEMVVLHGDVWRIPVDGVPVRAEPDDTTPFAQVIPFEPELEATIDEPTTCEDLPAAIDEQIATDAPMVAVEVSATFSALEVRSEPAQVAPYRPLEDVIAADQVSWDLTDVEATMVGFRTAESLESVSPPGYHFHALTDDEAAGGHVLSCTIETATVRADPAAEVVLDLS